MKPRADGEAGPIARAVMEEIEEDLRWENISSPIRACGALWIDTAVIFDAVPISAWRGHARSVERDEAVRAPMVLRIGTGGLALEDMVKAEKFRGEMLKKLGVV